MKPSIGPALHGLLSELQAAGVRLSLTDTDELRVEAPRGALGEALRQRLQQRRGELVHSLQQARSASQGSGPPPRITPRQEDAGLPCPTGDLQGAFTMGELEDMEFHVRPHYYLELDFEALDPGRFEQALNAALLRQRDNLMLLGTDLQLRPLPAFTPLRVPVHDLRALPADAQSERLQARRQAMSRRTLPLDRWPWLECEISLHGEGQARVHWNHNTFFGDGMASFRLMDAVKRLHDAPHTPLPPLTLSYRDCILALQRIEHSPLGEQSRAYWLRRIPALPGPPPLPLRAGLQRRRRSWLERRENLLPPTQWSALKAHANAQGLTPTLALFAAYAEVLSRWSGASHFLLNNMVTHRQQALHPELNEVFGNFASLYPLEVDWRGGGSFADRARALQRQSIADLQHTHWPGAKVLQALNQAWQTPGQAPCPFVVGSGLFMPPPARTYHACLETPQVMLDHQFWELQDGSLWTVWDLIEDCFPPGLIDAMWAAFRSLLQRLADDGGAWSAAAFDLLPADQLARRRQANATDAPLPAGLLHQGLERAARRWPERTAVADAQRSLSYAQLHCHANRLAHALRASGLRPGERVAVLLDKGWAQVVAVLGVLAAGGVYVPIAPSWPAARIRTLLDSVQAVQVVTRQALRERVMLPEALPAWCVDDASLGRYPGTTPPACREPGDPAYIIFTSGSTGTPKGVTMAHGAVLNTVADINHRLALSEHDVVFGVSELHFDLSVWDIFGTLSAGATLLLPATGDGPDPRAWARLARERGVTVWNSVPALMQLLADELEAGGQTLPALRAVMLSGDWIPLPLPARVRGVAPRSSLLSLGGATEAAIWSIAHPIGEADPDWPSVPYGRPLLNQRWHVLQEDGRPAPDWVPGELCIAGAGLAQGYWNDAARTAAAFRTDALTGERLYHTGDIGRYRPDGNIEFLGRLDNQVKVHGLRVEPGEIEQALTQLAAVSAAAVMVDDGAAGRRLVAFVVAERGAPADDALVFGGLRDSLPAHLLPSALVWLPGLPLTATGKLDRKALAKLLPQPAAEHAADVAPRNALEAALARLWQQVLGRAAVGVHDDFFALGGQSFSGLQLVGRVRHELGLPATLGMLLEARTVALLAQRLGAGTRPLDAVDTAPAASVLVPLGGPGVQPGNPGAPVFCVHPAGGSVWAYRPLAQQMGAPVFGLQAPALESGQAMPATIEAMAAAYVQALQRAQPSGPVRLMGWSSGGVIAFEMARQLEQQGRAVEQLVVLDCPAPGQHDMPDDDLLLRWFLQDLAGGVQPVLRPGASIPAGATLEAAMAAVAWPATQPQPPAAQALAPAFSVFQAVVRAVRCYRPKEAAVEAGVLLLRASEGAVDEFSQHPDAAAPDWGWRAFTRGPLRVLSVPGHHHTVLDEASMRAWLPAVREAWRNGGCERAAGADTASGA